MPAFNEFFSIYMAYRKARLSFLQYIGCPKSNRDPLAEASEYLVAFLLGGRLAANRVQKDYDVLTPAGEKIQVKYVSNPLNDDVNGHSVRFPNEADGYAVVVFEDLLPRGVIIFTRDGLAKTYDRLGKRHRGRGERLDLTKSNMDTVFSSPKEFEGLGARVFVL